MIKTIIAYIIIIVLESIFSRGNTKKMFTAEFIGYNAEATTFSVGNANNATMRCEISIFHVGNAILS